MAVPPDMGALRARLEQLLSQYGQVRSDLSAAQAKIRTVQGHAESADGGIKVTVGPRGALVGLDVDPRTYRKLGPSELTEQILGLTREAVRDVTGQMEAIMRPFLPKQVAYEDIINGNVDTAALATVGNEPVTDATFDEWRSGFGQPSQEEESRPGGQP